MVIDGEVAVLPNPQDVEGGGHGAFAGRQDRSHGQELARTAAWYDKTSPSFADAIALVRRHLWVQQGTFMPSEREHESIKVPRLLYHRMLDTLAYAA